MIAILALAASAAAACSWDYLIWIPRDKSADPLFRFIKDDKAGYIDVSGKVVIPPSLTPGGNYGGEFHDGLLEISSSDGKYVDRTGRVVIEKNLYRGWEFSEGLAAAMRKGEERWGYIDTSGEFVISPRFATAPDGYVYSFSEGLAMIRVKGQFGYIDRSGAFAIPVRFADATSFSGGMARVVLEGPCFYITDGPCPSTLYPGAPRPGRRGDYPACKFTYINKSGEVITRERYDGGREFSEGLAPVRLGDFWGFIDKGGLLVIPPKFEDAWPFSSGLSRFRENEKYGYLDKSGAVAVKPQFDRAENFSDGLAVVGDYNDRYWYINTRGERAFPGDFEAASPFFKGLAHVRFPGEDGRHAYIDTKGRQVFTY